MVVWSDGMEVKKAIEPEIHLAAFDSEVIPSSHVALVQDTVIAAFAVEVAKVSALKTRLVVALLTETEYVCG